MGYIDHLENQQKFRKYVRWAKRTVKIVMKQTGATRIVVRGISGMSVGYAVAYALDIPICVVRKDDDNNHSCRQLHEQEGKGDYLIIDDFISCGGTVAAIRDRIRMYSNSECVGIVLYSPSYTVKNLTEWDGIPLYKRKG